MPAGAFWASNWHASGSWTNSSRLGRRKKGQFYWRKGNFQDQAQQEKKYRRWFPCSSCHPRARLPEMAMGLRVSLFLEWKGEQPCRRVLLIGGLRNRWPCSPASKLSRPQRQSSEPFPGRSANWTIKEKSSELEFRRSEHRSRHPPPVRLKKFIYPPLNQFPHQPSERGGGNLEGPFQLQKCIILRSSRRFA